MKFRCPFCYYTVKTEESLRGYPLNCPSCSRTLTVPQSRFQKDCILGDFLIREKLGEGSIGMVFLATQLSLERQVALKILFAEYTTKEGIEHFLKEARATATLNHINLVQSFAVGEEDGICYMAMTYISGGSVMDRIRQQKMLPVDESLHIIQQAAEALYYAWTEKKIVHRDIKPDNIMITREGIVKITDLGLAVNRETWDENSDISGSPSYMAPELFEGGRPGPETDVYSLGITLYQMLTGVLPFQAKSVRTLAYQHLEETPVPPEKVNKNIPPEVSELVMTMIAKKPEKRFPDMDALLKAVWLVRQETAPAKELIPDIHTLSVRNLDYDVQRDSVQTRQEVSKLSLEVRRKKKDFRLLLCLLPVLVGVTFAITLYLYDHTPAKFSAENELTKGIFYLTRLVQDDTIPLQDIRDEGEKILQKFGKPANLRQRLLVDKVHSLIHKAELRRIRIENRNLMLQVKHYSAENQKLRQELRRRQEPVRNSGRKDGR